MGLLLSHHGVAAPVAMEDVVRKFSADWEMLEHRYPEPYSVQGFAEHHKLLSIELGTLDKLQFDKFDEESKVDWILLNNTVKRWNDQLALKQTQFEETAPLLPFANDILAMDEALRSGLSPDPKAEAARVQAIATSAKNANSHIESGATKGTQVVGRRALRILGALRSRLKRWFDQTDGYDPEFSFWVREPFQEADKALADLAESVRGKVVGIKAGDNETLIGDPIGPEALEKELRYSMIPYSSDEVLAIANREFAWCETEMKKASQELGFGDDWKKALLETEKDAVSPGQSRQTIRALEEEAIRFVTDRHLVTIPALGEQTWQTIMISPSMQKVYPFFFENEGDINVAYPAESMPEEQKISSLASNNIHFQRATVFHELYPGHALQEYYMARDRTYRTIFSTPFWMEGWAVNWEMEMYDLGFMKAPKDRIGSLFWRMHRCARIIFSINFHLGKMSPDQCVQFLMDKVGFTHDAAAGEVRRSISGDYEPLYQAAYMLGALQFRSLRHELIDSGKMTPMQFHDSVMQGNIMPIEMVRARLENQPLSKDWKTSWRF